jgi:hypothetical protein
MVNPMMSGGVIRRLSKGGLEDEDDEDENLVFPKCGQSDINYYLFLDIIGLSRSRSPFAHFVKAGMRPSVLRERCKSKWSVVAITSTLLANLALSNVTQTPSLTITASQADAPLSQFASRAFVILNFSSGCFNILAATVITIAWAALEGTPGKYTRALLSEFYMVMALPGAFFVLGAVCLLLGYLVLMHEYFGANVFWMSVTVGCGITLACAYLQTVMHHRTLEFLEKEYSSAARRPSSRAHKN